MAANQEHYVESSFATKETLVTLKSQFVLNVSTGAKMSKANDASDSSQYVVPKEDPISVLVENDGSMSQPGGSKIDDQSSYLVQDVQKSTSGPASQIVDDQAVDSNVSVTSAIVPATPRSGPISDFVEDHQEAKEPVASEFVPCALD